MARRIRLRFGPEVAGLRLDQAISQSCPDLSRGRARKLIARGSVFLAEQRVKVASRTVRAGQELVVYPDEITAFEPAGSPQAPAVRVVDEGPGYVIVDKPSGMMSAPTPETDQNDLLSFLEPTHGKLLLVHRLDRPTSGLMILARHGAAAARLAAQLEDRSLTRRYRAVLCGVLDADRTTCRAPIGGKDAVTNFSLLARAPHASLVLAQLETGRTHQIRIHAATLDAPVAGDSKYGRQLQRRCARAPRLALHAEELTFRDPDTGRSVSHTSPFPQELEAYFQSLC